MAGKVVTSDFMAKYADKAETATKAALSTEVKKTGFLDLPPGINNGVAKLSEMYFGTNENGDYFYCSGTVETPEYAGNNGSMSPVRGLRTKKQVSITEATFGDATKKITDILRNLFGDALFANGKINVGQAVEQVQKYLANPQSKPVYFWFRTWIGKKDETKINPKTKQPYEPRVQHDWMGTEGLQNYVPKGAGNPAPGLKEAPPKNADPTPWSERNPKPSEAKKETSKEPEKPVEYSDAEDISSLVTRASNDDQEAKDKLSDMAKEFGYTDDELENAESWEVIGDWVRGGKKEGGGDDKKDDEPFVPEAGNTICQFAPPDKRSRSGGRLKACQCSVEKIDKRSKSMRLKNLEKSDVYYDDVKWNDPNVTYE